MFKSLSKPQKRLAEQVYDQLLEAIQNNQINANDQIVQEKLAEQFEISRTPIREALLRLEQEGIIEASKRGGFKIRMISDQEIEEIYRAREAIEGYAIRFLALKQTPELLKQLHRNIQASERMSKKSVKDYFKANQAIHRAFVEATENRYLLEMFDNIWNRGIAFQLFASIKEADLERSLEGHGVIVDAIATGDAAIAFECMIHHINDGLSLQHGH